MKSSTEERIEHAYWHFDAKRSEGVPDRDAFKMAVRELLAERCDVVGDVAEFHAKFGLTYGGPPRVLDDALAEFRRKFLEEELREYKEDMYKASYDVQFRPERVTERLASMLDALVDLVYVAVGTAEYHGFPFAEAWRRVQAANMAKVRAASAADSKRGHAMDVVKPPGWVAPDHTDLVDNHIHRTQS